MVRLRDANPEMILAADVFAPNGLLMACRGQRVRGILAHRRCATWPDTMMPQPIAVAESEDGALPGRAAVDPTT